MSLVNYLTELSVDIGKIDHRFKNPDVCFACASALLGTVLPHVRIVTSIGKPLFLDEMNFLVGDSGVGKTLPLDVADRIARRIGVSLPSRYTNEGIETYFAETDGEGNFVHRSNGIIICDEIGQVFGEATSKSHYSGIIEQFSRLYDHKLPETALVRGVRSPQDPYVCVVAATIPQFLPFISDMFFQQGLAGRFIWVYCDIDTGGSVSISSSNNRVDELNDVVNKHASILSSLKDISCAGVQYLNIDPSADGLWNAFYSQCCNHWEYGRASCRFGWDWQYKIRLPELAIKQAGKSCIGRNIEHILEHGFEDVLVSCEDIRFGIQHIVRSDQQLQFIMELRKEGLEKNDKRSRIIQHRVFSEFDIVRVLENATNQTLNNKQLFESSGIRNSNTYTRIKKVCVEKGLIVLVDKSTITDKNERMRLGVDLLGPRLDIFRLVSGV